MLEEKYESLQELYTRNARLYHDLNNHLNTLYYMLENETAGKEAQEYIRTISQPIRDLKKIAWTGNDIIDVILSSKIHTMENAGIPHRITVDCPAETGIKASDICTVLSNLLDNAIEAYQKQPEQKEPIHIKIHGIRKFLLIQIINPSQPVQIVNGLPARTSKRNHSLHG